MAEVRKHIPLTIVRPGVEEIQEIVFVANVTDYLWKIPFRYPFDDIENYQALRTAGFFRHDETGGVPVVSSEYGGSAVVDVKTNLGYALPRTEKLILLVTTNAATLTDVTILTITGSTQYGIEDVEYTIPVAVAGKVYEIDLFNLGLLIDGGELNISIASVTAANNAKVSIALVARTA